MSKRLYNNSTLDTGKKIALFRQNFTTIFKKGLKYFYYCTLKVTLAPEAFTYISPLITFNIYRLNKTQLSPCKMKDSFSPDPDEAATSRTNTMKRS